MLRNLRARICDVIGLVAAANFMAWLLIGGFVIGGYALLGREDAGRYFLGNHGRYTEVSRAVFAYSRIHGYTALIGLGVGALAALQGHDLRKDKNHDETKIAG